MSRWRQGIAVLGLLAPALHAQFSLYQVSGSEEVPAGALFRFAPAPPGLPESATFLLVNATGQTQSMALLSVSGTGFSLAGAAAPTAVKAGGSVRFTVTFQATTIGAYSGSLDTTGLSVLLTASVAPALTYEVASAAGASPLGAAPIDFGSVPVGSSSTVHFLAVNQTTSALPVDAIRVAPGDFGLEGAPPSGTSLDPQASAAFSIVFQATAEGARSAVLTIGSLQFSLAGTGTAPPPPAPSLSVTLPAAQSAQQGSVAVTFGAPAAAAGSGVVTLSFQAEAAGATDPGIVFASGGETAAFTFRQGDSAASFGGAASAAFQTGTTAGELTLEARIGNQASRQSLTIAPAVIGVAAASGVRQGAGLTVEITGYDNTRTAGRLSFTFYDSTGGVIPPGAISADGSAAFSSYFAGTNAGGQFALTAYFPVTGDASAVSGFSVQLGNAAGTATTARANF